MRDLARTTPTHCAPSSARRVQCVGVDRSGPATGPGPLKHQRTDQRCEAAAESLTGDLSYTKHGGATEDLADLLVLVVPVDIVPQLSEDFETVLRHTGLCEGRRFRRVGSGPEFLCRVRYLGSLGMRAPARSTPDRPVSAALDELHFAKIDRVVLRLRRVGDMV